MWLLKCLDRLPLAVRPCAIILWFPTHKQEFCNPSLRPSLRCKTLAFYLPGLRRLNNFIMTRQLLSIYRDLDI
jgi:hypothetical protein